MMFRRLRNLIMIVGAILALVPSLTIGLGIVSIPPEIEARFAYLAGIVGLLVFLAVLVSRTALLRLKRPVLLALFAGSTVAGLVLAFWLAEVVDGSVRSVALRQDEELVTIAYLRPERDDYSAPLTALVDGKYRGNFDAALQSEPQRMLALMAEDDGGVQAKMMILLALAHALVLFGILLGAFAAVKAVGREADELLE